MKNLLGSAAIAFSLYSRIPMPSVAWTKERMRYAMCFFPLVGFAVGVLFDILSFVLAALEFHGPGRLLLAALPFAVTGGIHMDGFLDTVDARASHADRERKLEILKDPHTGAFAIIGGGVYLMAYGGVLLEMEPRMLPAYSGAFVLSRALSGLALVIFPKARNSGLAAAFSGTAGRRAVILTMAGYGLASLAYIWHRGGAAAGAGALLASAAVFAYYGWMAEREFGGITGDLAGYFLQVCELAVLMVLAAVSKF